MNWYLFYLDGLFLTFVGILRLQMVKSIEIVQNLL